MNGTIPFLASSGKHQQKIAVESWCLHRLVWKASDIHLSLLAVCAGTLKAGQSPESMEVLGGEPVKVEAYASSPEAKVGGSPTLSPTTPVDLELPVKLRLDHSFLQMAQYDEEDEELEEPREQSPTPADSLPEPPQDWIFNFAPGAEWFPDVWNSPMTDSWEPWFSPKMDSPYADEQFEVALAATPPDYISQGSALHGTGACRPCAWYWKPGSCQNKENCSYCHLCPEGELKARKKAKVAMMRLGVITPKAKEHTGEVLNLSSLV
ncbi:unnamed protein product [Symbiodinium necroappetens]|uniref:C3H1-type domain-containing protein n=1 Tax=Symbiodinium necroappetens TaxID=1628268 RepID=A0A813C4J6_9DINO|nr:unnamed protein product [Symbiodinium necroappetens]